MRWIHSACTPCHVLIDALGHSHGIQQGGPAAHLGKLCSRIDAAHCPSTVRPRAGSATAGGAEGVRGSDGQRFQAGRACKSRGPQLDASTQKCAAPKLARRLLHAVPTSLPLPTFWPRAAANDTYQPAGPPVKRASTAPSGWITTELRSSTCCPVVLGKKNCIGLRMSGTDGRPQGQANVACASADCCTLLSTANHWCCSDDRVQHLVAQPPTLQLLPPTRPVHAHLPAFLALPPAALTPDVAPCRGGGGSTGEALELNASGHALVQRRAAAAARDKAAKRGARHA